MQRLKMAPKPPLQKPPLPANALIRAYLNELKTDSSTDLTGTTLNFIKLFFDNELEIGHPRLNIAVIEFNYTLDEIMCMKTAGKTFMDVVNEINSR